MSLPPVRQVERVMYSESDQPTLRMYEGKGNLRAIIYIAGGGGGGTIGGNWVDK